MEEMITMLGWQNQVMQNKTEWPAEPRVLFKSHALVLL